MRILFVMYAFPNLDEGFNMFTTIVEEFANKGYEVCVLAPGNSTTGIYLEKEIEILRVRSLPTRNISKYLMGISNILLPFLFYKALKKFYPNKQFDLIISPTPPITFGGLISKLKNRDHARFYLILRDIFPQNAVDLKYFRKGSLYHKYFRKVEVKYYKTADFIGCMSQANITYMTRHNPFIPLEKLHILRNFQKLYSGDRKQNAMLRKEYGLGDSFVAVFGGNMGKAQQLENVLELAKRCQEYKDVKFLLLGEGFEMDVIAEKSGKDQISNIIIQRSLPKAKYQDLISVCDLGLISLHQDFTIPNIPSKSLDYWNVGIPILASIDSATDFNFILNESNSGLWSLAGDHEAFFKNFEILYHNPDLRKKMGMLGKQYFNNHLTPEIAYMTIINSYFKSNN